MARTCLTELFIRPAKGKKKPQRCNPCKESHAPATLGAIKEVERAPRGEEWGWRVKGGFVQEKSWTSERVV